MLAAPPLEVDVHEEVKVDVRGGECSVTIFKRDSGLPSAVAKLPFRLVFIDTKSLSMEDMDAFTTLPGRGKFSQFLYKFLGNRQLKLRRSVRNFAYCHAVCSKSVKRNSEWKLTVCDLRCTGADLWGAYHRAGNV